MCALFIVGCEGGPAGSAPGLDGSVDGGARLCARAAEGCACAPGTGPVDCYVRGEEDGVCHAGQMYCQDGAWSACEWTRAFTDDEVGSASGALITGFETCSTCNPGCARATDEPDATDLSTDNSSGVVWSDEGGVTLDTRVPPYLPSCAELAAGLPPGGTYERYCDEAGTLFFSTGSGTSVCASELAADTFEFGLCTCESLDGSYRLVTDSFDSATGAYGVGPTGNDGDVGTNMQYALRNRVDIGGKLVGYGTSQHFPLGLNEITGGMWMNGPFRTTSQLRVGTISGDAYINGSTDFGSAVTVEGGAGTLTIPASATWGYSTPAGQQSYTLLRDAVTVERPCDSCEPAEQVDIPAFVAYTATRNDNWVIGLDPDELNGFSGGTHVTLPCGRFYLTNVTGSGALTITATGRTALFIDGDLSTTSSMKILLGNDDAEVDVFVAGNLSAGSSLELGDKDHPAQVRLYVGGTAPIVFRAGSEIGGNFYAPNADVDASGEMSVYGALYSKHLSAGSNANIHYDVAVRTPSCPPVEGRYWRDYDSTTYCGTDSESRPDWGQFTWDADIPDGTDIRFEVQTADTEAALSSATAVGFVVPPNGAPVDIGDLLVAAGQENHHPFLRITARLRSDGIDAPLLRSMSLDIDCGFGTSGVSDPGAWTCSGSPPTCVQVCPAEVCDDGLDNDCDGASDCGDASCGTSELCCTGEICGDGISNDCDDLVDYWDLGECTCTAELCTDGLDNDSDAATDCADTTNCAAGTSCNPWGSTCVAGACVCPTGTAETSCTDGMDEDCDGVADCDDSDCGGTMACPMTEGCTDGIDNDFDGVADCADVGDCPEGATCGGAGLACNAAGACACPGGATETVCTDGIDEDCDGATDCADTDCSGAACDAMGRVCSATFLTCRCPTGVVESSCLDGADNDCDGLVDCADVDCDGVACAGAGRVCHIATASCICPGGGTETACGDGADNDCDFSADCTDADCDGMSCGASGEVCDFATGVCL